MASFGTRRKDYSIQPPKQQVDGTPFFVTDSANIDFTLANLNLTANLTQLLPTSGTYGSSTLIPILDIDEFGRVTGVTTTTFSASGILLQTNDVDNISQVILNLKSGTDIQVVDLGGGVIEFNYTGTSGNTYTVNNGLTAAPGNIFQLGGTSSGTGNLIRDTYITNDDYIFRIDQTGTAKSALYLSHLGTGVNYGVGLTVQVADGRSIRASSTGNVVFEGVSQADYTAELTRSTATTTGIEGILKLVRGSSGVPAPDIGGSIDFWIKARTTTSFPGLNTAAPTEPTVRLVGLWENPGYAIMSRLSRFDIYGFKNNTTIKNASVTGNGKFTLYQYGQTPAAFLDTPVWSLGVNAAGDVIEFDVPSGTGTVTSVNSGTNINVDNTNPAAPIINSLADRYKTSSVTSNSISNGSKNFTIDLNLSYIPLQEILVVFDPSKHMHGEVTSYNAANGALVVDIKNHTGSGTYTSWVLNLDGTPVDAITGSGTANEVAYFTAARVLASLPVATYPSLTELSYVKGVTSAIQTQINGKQDTLTTTKSVKIVSNNVELDGDNAAPGNDKVYGTSPTGVKGWQNAATGGGITELTTDVTTPAASSGVTAATLKANLKKGSFGVTVDGVSSVIQVGQTGFVTLPYDGVITGWSITTNAPGSIQFDVWKDALIDTIPTSFDSIVGGVYPTLTTNQLATSTSVGSWNTAFSAGHVFGFYVNSVSSTVKNATLTIRTTKT